MDKYTVDIDKVLNDFEYSELTEQNNSVYNQSLNQNQSYLKPSNTTKHSINNVFNSLNEYLNTDIKAEFSQANSNLSEIHEIETLPTLIPKTTKDKSDIASIQEIFNAIAKENVTSEKNITSNEEQVIDSPTVLIVDKKDEEDKDSINSINENNVSNEVIENTDDFEEQSEEKEQITEEESISVNLDEPYVVNIESQPQPKVLSFNDVELSDTEIENELVQLEQEYEKENMENNEEINLKLELEESILKQTIIKKEADNNNEYVQLIGNEESYCDVIEDLKGNSKEIVSKKEEVDYVETSNQINQVDNEEKNELKETLENDSCNKNQIIIVEPSDVEDTLQKTENELNTNNAVRRNSAARPNSLDLNSESTNENLTINLIGEPGSTPYSNFYNPSNSEPTNFMEVSTLSVEGVEAEINHSLSPTLSDASTYNSDSPNTSDSCNETSLDEHSIENTPKSTRILPKITDNNGGDNFSSNDESSLISENSRINENNLPITDLSWLGKTAPFWTPDSDALCCLHCNQKFTVIKRRHHCRACGLVLCSKCCNMKCKLPYMDNAEARVCSKCYDILKKDSTTIATSSGSDNSPEASNAQSPSGVQNAPSLNPNNPMEYCSKIPPHQQVAGMPTQPPSVMVPVGVLKRKGSGKTRTSKSVMFCDGIRPGCDLTELDRDFNYKENSSNDNIAGTNQKKIVSNTNIGLRSNRNLPKIDSSTNSYIPKEGNALPPIVTVMKSDILYEECSNNNIVEILKNQTITFALHRNLHVHVRIINMDCCINKLAWCFSSEGMIMVGQDEIVILLEFIDNEKVVPKDIFLHLNSIYSEAVRGTSIPEMGLSIHPTSNFLESKNHAGFLYIKPTFQCIQNVIIPKEPYLIGILIHRWETPWAKIFPLRLLLRLGAEYRYYPAPIISTRHRESVYVEIGHTIIQLLADFRNFSYTIPSVRGLTIHMEEKNTTVSIPVNRYDQVMKALNNSSDHILAFAANFSPKADSHLVCIQDTHGNNENAYTTHAINIHNKPRKVTGASFIVLNGALKSSSGLIAKSSIVEDGLMVQIPPEHMVKLRESLRIMKDHRINCGCINAASDESVNIIWTASDVNFNVGVISPIDGMQLSGIPSIRVHNGRDFMCNSGNKMIRWTEVFIIQSGEECVRTQDPIDVSKISESISKATSQALAKYLDLLATNSCSKIGIRTTLNIENVSYLAGSNGIKLPPIYMKSLDNELVPVLHRITSSFNDQATVVLELMFHILNF